VVTRAGISKNVLHEVFATVEECYRAAFDEGLKRLSSTVAEATARDEAWLERVRSGLVAFLGFFDDEPSWGRLLVLDTPLDTAVTFQCRQRLHALLAGVLERDADAGPYCAAGRAGGSTRAGGSPALFAALAGELVVGGVLSVIRASMLEDGSGKLVELAPSLMAFIVAPYLGRAAAQAELEGKPAGAGEAPAADPRPAGPGPARVEVISHAGELPVRATHRTTLVLRVIARAPYSTNRGIAQAAGLADEGQTSKLLARLQRQGVIENVGLGPARGEPNAWVLTASGRRTVELINQNFAKGAPRPRRAHMKEVS
jgi:AcrR family transcriptional regulator